VQVVDRFEGGDQPSWAAFKAELDAAAARLAASPPW